MRIGLRYKLFAALLLANAILTAVIVYANNRAFTTSFEAYLGQVQSRRLAPLLNTLAEEYEQRGHWQWLVDDPEAWQRLTRRYLWHREPQRGEVQRPRRGPRELSIQLRDGQQRVVAGSLLEAGRTTWLPIEAGGRAVGSLGVPVNLRLTAEFDEVFAEQQRRQLRWIALAALMLAGAIAVPLASLLVRPITRLQAALHQLASGQFDLQLSVRGSDELADLARDANVLAASLQQNLHARQRWIADISHELRTPVGVLQAELEALQDGISTPDPTTLNSLHQEILRLGRLISDLHELSLSDAGALTYHKAPVDLGAVLEEVCGHYKTSLAQRHIQLDYRPPKDPISVHGDRDRLVQLFANLMQNTINYTEGSTSNPGQLHIRLKLTQGAIQVSWCDSAPGVPPEALPRLFDRLYRVESSRNRATGGSGLGLAIASNILEAHGGRVKASASDLGGLGLQLQFPRSGEPL